MYKIFVLCLLFSHLGFSQNYTLYSTGSNSDVDTDHKPGICLMGGGSEHDEAMRWFLKKAAGGDVVVLRASGSDGYNEYFYSELGVPVNSVKTFVIHNSNGAVDPVVLEKVSQAEAIWFAGGDQYDYVRYFKDNAMEDVLNDFINNKKGVIGGTSAGMAILGGAYFSAANGTVTSAEALADPYHPKVTLGYSDFLDIPILKNAITDTHYDERNRRGRHSVFLARFSKDNSRRSFGIACNGSTAVCIEPDGRAAVYGNYPHYDEFAYFLQATCATDSLPEQCVSGSPLTWERNGEALKVYKVAGTPTGTHYFDLENWESASGGEWQNWSVVNGDLMTAVGEQPSCTSIPLPEEETHGAILYPNPFSEDFTISTKEEIGSAQLYDTDGRTFTVTLKGNNLMEASNLATGLYILRVQLASGDKLYKILKK